VFGVVMAWLVAVIVAAGLAPASATASTALAAGIASFLIVMASRWAILSLVPATFYGFAATFACLSLSPGAFTVEVLTALAWKNALFSVPASLLIGTGLGIVHGWLAGFLSGEQTGLTIKTSRNIRDVPSPTLRPETARSRRS
jgi:Protein of unknown function (DUF1097)